MKTVAQILGGKANQSLHTIGPQDSVLDALRLMAAHNIGALPVVDDDGRLVGIVSERDYARQMVLKGRSSFATPVSTIMTPGVVTVTPAQALAECLQLMTDRRLRHLPVVDGGLLVGLLSIGDLVKETIAEQRGLIEQLERYIRGE